MKVNFSGKIDKCEIKKDIEKVPCSLHSDKSVEVRDLAAFASLGKSQVQKRNPVCDEFKTIVNGILSGNETLDRVHNSLRQKRIFGRIYAPHPEYKIPTEIGSAMCTFDNDGIKNVYILRGHFDSIDVLNKNGITVCSYDKENLKALKEYKYSCDYIHEYLRHGRIRGNADELLQYIDGLDKIFSDNTKTMKNDETRKIYRALQSDLTPDDIEKLSFVGNIFVEKSFCSTTTSLEVAKRFSGGKNPILEIDFPKDAKYLDIENLFNIDHEHWREDEFLLNRNSKFLVTGFDEDNNIIKVKYIE